ncbi:DciA family protein [Streptomyces sp. NPDC029006]|uniref:DciA family protein n=1 Tax=Streptomyces sp. NPDC029006 TaxID=3155467 RepID=UPI00340A1744
MADQASGADLARQALAVARAAAKTRPTQPPKKTRGARRPAGRRLGDPMGLGAAIDGLMADHGWEPPETGGSIIDHWPTIAPELADKVAAVTVEHNTGTLHLRPVSPAYATQLRLHQAGILAKVQQAPSGRSVRALKILPAGPAPTPSAVRPDTPARPAETAPARTRETASTGYRQALAAALEHRTERRHTDPYIEQAMARQEAALRANRQPEPAEELPQPPARRVDRSDAVRRAALARKRQEQAGETPRRLFGAA